MPTVWAVSDLHGAVKTNSERIDQLTPPDPADWLIVAGDVAERTDLIIRILRQLNDRYARVIWVPGNHELFSRSQDRYHCLLYTSPSPRDRTRSRMPSSA